MRWTVLIATKSLPAAKSRLIPATHDARAHRRLVEAIRADTVAAARAATRVARVVIVCDGPHDPARYGPGLHTFVQRGEGLNAALAQGAGYAHTTWPGDAIAALVGDLPALRPADLDEALALAAQLSRAFVPDQSGTGTTMLTTLGEAPLEPRFGPGSAARHAEDATRLAAAPGLRHDVDTPADLLAARHLGVGTATAALLNGSPVASQPSQHGIVSA